MRIYSLPKSHKIRTIIKIVPKIPLGPYPQLALCGHEGIAPMSNKIRIMINTVLNMTTPFLGFMDLIALIFHILINKTCQTNKPKNLIVINLSFIHP